MSRLSWTPEGRKTVRRYMKALKEQASTIFRYKDDDGAQIMDFVLMPVIALHWKTENPLWCQVIGPPGSGKTAHIQLLEKWHNAKFISRLTKNSLISGFRPDGDINADPSFLKQLNGKLFVVKDFTCILQGPKEERDSVVGQLRDMFDGKASRVFGNIGFKEYTARFNMILAVTNIIDGFYGVNTQLGERFISRREFAHSRKAMTRMALENVLGGRRSSDFSALSEAFIEFVELLPQVSMRKIHWPDDMKTRAVLGADFIAACRSHVQRESDGKSIATCPAPEVGTRLVTQIVQCVAAYCIVNGLTEVNTDAWNFGGARVLRDTLPSAISWCLFKIYAYHVECLAKGIKPEFTVKELLPVVRLGYDTVERITTDLYHNGILNARYVGRTGRRNTEYSLRSSAFDTIRGINLFNGMEEKDIDINLLKESIHRHERNRSRIETEELIRP